MEFSKHAIRIKDQKDICQVLQAISSLQDLVVVNIADSAEMRPILLSEENLHAILADAPESLFVEALPLGEYKKLMRDKIDQVVQSAISLRATLRTNYVADLAAQVRDFLKQLDQIFLMLKCYALQNAQSSVAENVQKLQILLGQLAASSFEHGDNVRCMDDLQYQILPALKNLLKMFRK